MALIDMEKTSVGIGAGLALVAFAAIATLSACSHSSPGTDTTAAQVLGARIVLPTREPMCKAVRFTRQTGLMGLRWLKAVQNEDGSWPGDPVSSTALALWTYLDHNEVPADDTEFGPVVRRGLQFLLSDLDSETGRFRSARDDPFAQPLGAFAIALGHSMTRNPLLREAGPAASRPLFAGQRRQYTKYLSEL